MNILIRTTQNVELVYPLADPLSRFAAFLIDLIFAAVLYFLGLMVFSSSASIQIILIILFFFVYHLTFEIVMNGQTPGKNIVKIQVISVDGNPASLEQLMMRWSFRLLDIGVTLGSLGFLAMISSELRQKLGDSLAGTIVINKRISGKNSLDILTKLNELNKDNINPKLRQYNDDEMLVVKNLLSRVKSYPTIDNKKLLRKLSDTIKMDLGESNDSTPSEQYLHKVLNDYIIITR